MNRKIHIEKIESGKGEITNKILRALPDWFGIESSIINYVKKVESMPFWKVTSDNRIIGFLAVKIHFPQSAEFYVMGIIQKYHRQGIGKMLLGVVEKYLKENGIVYLQVKTLSESHPDLNYAKTRRFYLSLGFNELEEFKTLWGESSPCLLMVKKL